MKKKKLPRWKRKEIMKKKMKGKTDYRLKTKIKRHIWKLIKKGLESRGKMQRSYVLKN